MASISRTKGNGHRRIDVMLDGERKTIRLGKMTQRDAEAVNVKIEALVSAKKAGHAPDDATLSWLDEIDTDLYDRLAKVKLVKPRESVTVQAFIDQYIGARVDVEPGTHTNYKQIRRYIFEYFDQDRLLRDISVGDAEDFRLYLMRRGAEGKRKKLAENTIRRAVGRTRQFFQAAKKRGLIPTNPFEGLPAVVKSNPERLYFITLAEAEKVLEACPDAQWRLIFALCRFGGLRCPTEVLALRWADVDWDKKRIRVTSKKTKRHEGKESRIIPLFPELERYLLECYDPADPSEYVISRRRTANVNLRTQLQRIIRRAGLEPWPKLFQNLRSTRETELAQNHPMHVVCKWLGNGPRVAVQHYLQVTDEHYRQAVEPQENGSEKAPQKAPHNAPQKAPEGVRIPSQTNGGKDAQTVDTARVCDVPREPAETCGDLLLTPTGFEPVLSA